MSWNAVAMTGDITARIAEIIVKHSICDCGEWAESFEENARHMAEQIVQQLGLCQEEYRSVGCPDNMDFDRVRICGPWQDVS